LTDINLATVNSCFNYGRSEMKGLAMKSMIGVVALLAASLGSIPASAAISCGSSPDFPCKDPISVFGPVTLGPPGVFGGPDEPDTRFGQQLLILNNGQYVLQATATGAFYGSSFGRGRADLAWRYAENKNYAAVSCSNYNCDTDFGPEESANNFFTFNLDSVSGPISQAVLSIGNGPVGVRRGPDGYKLFDVATPLDDLLGEYPLHGTAGNPIAIYNDLMSGTEFGRTSFGSAQNGSQIEIWLNLHALRSIEAHQGRTWAIGGTAIPEPKTWALLIAGFGLVGAVSRRRRARAA
jgi:hypothetical protein